MRLLDALLLEPYFPLDYYLAARTDGVGGTGTLNDPWNASTVDRFDQIMREKIPPFAHIHIGSGVFNTRVITTEPPLIMAGESKPVGK